MELTDALDWAADRRNAVLITLRRDGRAQSSDIAYVIDGGDIVISLTDSRAKTANIRRDPRVVVHLSQPSSYTYLSFDGIAALTPVAASPDDGTVDALVEYYRTIAGEHDDWNDYRAAMVAEGRLICRVTPTSVVGMING